MTNIEVTRIPQEYDRFATQADILEACQDGPFSGYPAPEDRWHISVEAWDEMAETGIITVPPGPHAVLDHPFRQQEADKGVLLEPADPAEIDPAQKAAWREQYELVTDSGLPVHPMAKLGVTSEIWSQDASGFLKLHKLGMATGVGRERRHGAIQTAALLLARRALNGDIEYPVATEQRGAKLRRSFPGGYVEPEEPIAEAAIREANEEVNIREACEAAGLPWQEVESLQSVLWELSPAITGPCTLNVWLAEHFLVIDATTIPDMQSVVLRNGEPNKIQQVEWLPGRELLTDPTLLGAHRRALRAHLGMLAI
jgi:8-oxo-dGTP pyrophosphatase MutT (NUDIX family)